MCKRLGTCYRKEGKLDKMRCSEAMRRLEAGFLRLQLSVELTSQMVRGLHSNEMEDFLLRVVHSADTQTKQNPTPLHSFR